MEEGILHEICNRWKEEIGSAFKKVTKQLRKNPGHQKTAKKIAKPSDRNYRQQMTFI